jgi:peptidoglycan/LPS O-acetylase OafA/YrhL
MHLAEAEDYQEPIKYRPDVDGLRAVAITSVVAYHCGLPWASGGFVGVDVFFVISGYLIGSLVYTEIKRRSFTLRAFYARRARRILPALFAVLIFSSAAAIVLFSPREMSDFAKSALATITSSSNIYFWKSTNYFAAGTDLNPLLMTWSLGVEEQFYLLFPLLMIIFSRFKWRSQLFGIAMLAVLSLAGSIWGSSHRPVPTFYLLPTRAWELSAGVLLCMFELNRPHAKGSTSPIMASILSAAGLGLIVLAILHFDRTTPFPGSAALLPVTGAVLIIGTRSGLVNRALSWRPIVFIGLISYSWYLWHWPLLSFIRAITYGGMSTQLSCLISLLSLGFAILCYRFVERQFRKSTTPTILLLKRYGIALVLIAILPAYFIASQGMPGRYPAVQSMDQSIEQIESDQCLVHTAVIHPPLYAPCVPMGNGPAIALIGDSHAAALASALRPMGWSSGYRLVELNKGNCPPLLGVTPSYAGSIVLERECLEFNRERLDYIEHESEISAVVVAGYWSDPLYSEDRSEDDIGESADSKKAIPAKNAVLFEQGLDTIVSGLRKSGKVVYVVQDDPGFAFDPVKFLRNKLIWPRRELANLLASNGPDYPDEIAPELNATAAASARTMIDRVIAANPGVRVVDPRGAFCVRAGCRFAIADQTLYVDENHLSQLGAQRALAEMRLP